MRTLLCSSVLLTVFFCRFAFAGLGEHEERIVEDALPLHGQHSVGETNGTYHTHHIVTGIHAIKEFSVPNSKVFAVTWTGRSVPDLQVLLASYFAEYKKALASKAKIHGRAPFHIETEHIILDIHGHAGEVRGQAIIKGLMPQGLDPKQLR